MPGVYASLSQRRTQTIQGFKNAALVASEIIGAGVCCFKQARIRAVEVSAGTAGTGAGNTVIDVRINGVSAYTTVANRPTLLATSTGEFANTLPDTILVRNGDRVDVWVQSISTTGHAVVGAGVLLEEI